MALLRVDWNPSPRKIRQFGGLLCLFALLAAGMAWRKGNARAAVWIGPAGALLGAACAAAPVFGIRVYQAWMAVAFVTGTAISTAMLFLLYFGFMTPLGLFFRLIGRDALRLKARGDSYWVPLEIPDDKTYFERLS